MSRPSVPRSVYFFSTRWPLRVVLVEPFRVSIVILEPSRVVFRAALAGDARIVLGQHPFGLAWCVSWCASVVLLSVADWFAKRAWWGRSVQRRWLGSGWFSCLPFGYCFGPSRVCMVCVGRMLMFVADWLMNCAWCGWCARRCPSLGLDWFCAFLCLVRVIAVSTSLCLDCFVPCRLPLCRVSLLRAMGYCGVLFYYLESESMIRYLSENIACVAFLGSRPSSIARNRQKLMPSHFLAMASHFIG